MWPTPNPFLGVTKRVGEVNESVTRVEIESRVNAGISWKSLGQGMVPIFEEHSARLERGYSLEKWYALDGMERAMVIAAKRIDTAMKNHYSEAESKQMKRDSKKRSR